MIGSLGRGQERPRPQVWFRYLLDMESFYLGDKFLIRAVIIIRIMEGDAAFRGLGAVLLTACYSRQESQHHRNGTDRESHALLVISKS
jgi:hypothetical protein